MGRRPYRSRRSTRSLDPSTNSDAVGLGVGPAATTFRWAPDFRALVVTFDANVIVTSGIAARARYTDSNGVNYICEGEATGSGSSEVGFPMVYDRSNPTPTPLACSSLGIGNAVRGVDGIPAQEFYSNAVTEDEGSSGPKIVAAFFEDAGSPTLTCIFNMAVNCEDATSDIFVYSQVNGATLQPNALPVGAAGGTAMLRWTSFAPAGTTPPGTIKVIGATSSIIGDANEIEMSNLNDYPFTPGPPIGQPAPHVLTAQWDNDNLQMELTFDQDVVPIGDISGRITFRDANNVTWISKAIAEVADETVLVDFEWALTSNEITTASSNALGTALRGQISGAPAADFTQITVNDGGDNNAPFLVHASYSQMGVSLTLYFNQAMTDAGTTAGKIAIHLPVALGDATVQSAAEVTVADGIVTVTLIQDPSVIEAAVGTTSCNLAGPALEGANNSTPVEVWTDFGVTILQ